jgi:hypothetical protein
MGKTLVLLMAGALVAVVAPARAQAPAVTVAGWRIQVAVSPMRMGPISISTSPVRRAKPNDARPWLRHDLTFSNRGAKVVRFEDTRRSTFLGGRRLLAADRGCGYGKLDHAPWTEAGVCLLYLDPMTVRPGRSQVRDVTLFRGLRGMETLRPGRYVFAKAMRFRVGSGPLQTRTLHVAYTIS